MKKLNKKDMIILVGASTIGMLSGIVIGMVKEKMKLDSYCVIEEM